MRSAGSKLLFLSLLVIGILVTSQVHAAEGEPPADRFSLALEGIKTQLAALDQQQKQILANQQEIFARLDQLRIWVHRK